MQSIDPKIWGPKYWYVMITTAEAYPTKRPEKNIIQSTANFFNSMKDILPCENCREHYSKLIKQYPVENYLHTRQALVNWVKMIQKKIDHEHSDRSKVKFSPTSSTSRQSNKMNQMHEMKSAKQQQPLGSKSSDHQNLINSRNRRSVNYIRGRNYIRAQRGRNLVGCQSCKKIAER